MKNVEDENIRAEIERLIEDCGGQRPAAASLGISPQYLHDIFKNRRWITEDVAKRLGYERVVIYRKKEDREDGKE